MTCELSGYVYQWDCVHCMVRKTRNLGSRGDPVLSARLRLEAWHNMKEPVKTQVQEFFRRERESAAK